MPNLPVELQREIFEIAVRSNHKDASLKLNLSLVAHYVHLWVDTVFYKMVTILCDASGTKFLELIHSKPPGFFGPVVKSLLLVGVRAPSCARILSTCTGVQSLAWWALDNAPLVLSAVSQLPLQRLVVGYKNLIIFTAALPPPVWLTTLTHLDTSAPSRFDGDLNRLGRLPRLTHVSLFAPNDTVFHAQTVVDSCPNLQILVMPLDKYRAATPVSLVDSRIVGVVSDSADGFIGDWEAAHFGLPNSWTRAEDVLIERKRLAALEQAADQNSS
ncbi:hypothetical protein C8R45DRAFT_1086248 [Mycena sanguinolenta]|nr:hypothetical protein C8R45DRAFT_1086248 [Mycena sanguinolenta]